VTLQYERHGLGEAYSMVLDEASLSIYSLGMITNTENDKYNYYFHSRINYMNGDLSWVLFKNSSWNN